MTELGSIVKRNCKLFFKDKGMFFTSLITPAILLVLYATFLGNVYESSFQSAIPDGVNIEQELIRATVGGELASSLLAVCCITVAFCSGLLMVQDKVSGSIKDLTVSPVKSSTLAIGYFISTALSTLLICFVAVAACMFYLYTTGWFISLADFLLICLDVVLLVLFGTALSSIVSYPLSTSGQASAVGTIVSAGYGFVCGAYMPISSFQEGLQRVLSFLPGTYGTSLLRNHFLRGVFSEMNAKGFPDDVVEGIRDSIDCNLYFFSNKVEIGRMYLILALSSVVLIAIYVLLNFIKRKKV